MQVGIAKRPLNDAPHCGDECGCWKHGGKTTLCVVDGLGHGEYAETAAKAAMNYVALHRSQALPKIFAGLHPKLRDMRGVVMGIAVINEDLGSLTYGGVGNTRAMIFREPGPEFPGGKTVRLAGNSGVVGWNYKSLILETGILMPGDLVLMYTDGLAEFIDISGYDKALRRDVQALAEKILQDWNLDRDDAAVIVSRRDVSSNGRAIFPGQVQYTA